MSALVRASSNPFNDSSYFSVKLIQRKKAQAISLEGERSVKNSDKFAIVVGACRTSVRIFRFGETPRADAVIGTFL